jgi:hypothetical protein
MATWSAVTSRRVSTNREFLQAILTVVQEAGGGVKRLFCLQHRALMSTSRTFIQKRAKFTLFCFLPSRLRCYWVGDEEKNKQQTWLEVTWPDVTLHSRSLSLFNGKQGVLSIRIYSPWFDVWILWRTLGFSFQIRWYMYVLLSVHLTVANILVQTEVFNLFLRGKPSTLPLPRARLFIVVWKIMNETHLGTFIFLILHPIAIFKAIANRKWSRGGKHSEV